MSAIKRFFEKKKLDRKFKKAGEGHSLTAARQPSASTSPRASQAASSSYRPPTADQQRAAEAAMSRLQAQSGKYFVIETRWERINITYTCSVDRLVSL